MGLRTTFGFTFVLTLSMGYGFSPQTMASGDPAQLIRGREAIGSLVGCYLVDYSFAETESLQSGYARDNRIYDVNRDKSIKEWIYAEAISPTRVRLQHILFGTDLAGVYMQGSALKHQAEDWEYGASYLYDFVGTGTWKVKSLATDATTLDQWTRKITNLDDGPRYQCAAAWLADTQFPEWTCRNYSPIPGRETRDMKRKDYQALDRTTRIIAYQNSWLERQSNTKTIDQAGVRTPLAKELGKTWYVRLPDSECTPVQSFVSEHSPFWALTREVWDEVLAGQQDFVEQVPSGQGPRYARVFEIEARYLALDLTDQTVRDAAKAEIRKVIEEYRGSH